MQAVAVRRHNMYTISVGVSGHGIRVLGQETVVGERLWALGRLDLVLQVATPGIMPEVKPKGAGSRVW